MTTIVNNPVPVTTEDGTGVGMILGIILALVIIALLVIFGIPAFRNSTTASDPMPTGATNINVTLPAATPSSGTTAR